MNLTAEQLERVQELAGLFLIPREIAVIMDLPVVPFVEEIELTSSELYMAYYKGKTISKYEIRQKIISLAKMGSPPAQALADKYIQEQEILENE